MRYFLTFLMLFSCAKSKETPNSSKGDLLSPPNDGDIEFVSVSDAQTLPYFPGQPLIGGTEQKPEEYPANFYTAQGNSRCSATMIGDRVLLLAAHCVGNGATAKLTYKGQPYVGTCSHHPGYRNNVTTDYAICMVDKSLPDMVHENILMDQSKLKVGMEITLTGFGCINPGGGGGNDQKFRVGKAPITSMPSGSDNDIVTKGTSALCFGDSGSGAYYYEGDSRWDVSVNSRGDIRTTSYLSSFTPLFQTWAKTWAESKGLKICGMHADAKSCRGASAPPPPTPCKIAHEALGQCIFAGVAVLKLEECQKHYATLFACLEEAARVEVK